MAPVEHRLLRRSGHTLFHRRLLLFTGKGGVGKSSVVAGLATHLGAQGRRPLVVEIGDRGSMESIFASPRIGYEPRAVGDGVWAMKIEFESALRDYLSTHVPVKRLAKSIGENQTLQRFFRAAPSVSEVTTLNKLSSLESARMPGDRNCPRWDPILVDLDATGHALMLLGLPSVMDGLIGEGPMRRLIDGFSSLLADPKRTSLSLVTLPKELPTQETIELHGRLRADHGVHLGALFVNRVPSPPFTEEQLALFEILGERATASEDQGVLDDLALGRRLIDEHQGAQKQLMRLRREIDLPVCELPVFNHGVGSAQLQSLGTLIVERLAAATEERQ